jgi:hypothetical protein
MVYWIIVLTVWLISLISLLYSGYLLISFLQGRVVSLIELGLFLSLGLFFNFLVVNWPVETPAKKGLDEKAVKTLRYLAKVAPLAPKAVREGIEKLLEKYG